MLFIKNVMLSLLLFSTSLGISQANNSDINWQSWDEQTLVHATEQNKLVLIKLTAKWCPFCKKMDQTTYIDNAVVKEVNAHYIAIKVDDEQHPEIAAKYSHIGFPGTVILDQQGNIVFTKTGYLKPQWMLWSLQAVSLQSDDNQLAHE